MIPRAGGRRGRQGLWSDPATKTVPWSVVSSDGGNDMSWDVMVFHLRSKPQSLDDLKEENLLPLGIAETVRAAVSAALHDRVDWSDPTWGMYDGHGFSIEFNVGKEDPIKDMMLHVRGGGDAIAEIMKIVVANGWTALDCSTDDFLDPAAPSDAGWTGFQSFRDKIIERSRDDVSGEG